jgi:hypothetical protein
MTNDELERIWKEEVIKCSQYNPKICLEGLRNTTRNFRIAGISRDSNRAPPKCMSRSKLQSQPALYSKRFIYIHIYLFILIYCHIAVHMAVNVIQ